MKTITDKTLRETIYCARAKCGLPVYVWPSKGLCKKFATVAVNYGSIDNVIVRPGQTAPVTMPGGVAHFLEHRLFEIDGHDVTEKFSEMGASVNAMTSFVETSYYFSTTTNFDSCVGLLLGMLSRPTFTDAQVEREKDIIAQEIMMSNDSAGWREYFGLMRALYAKHPARDDIGGSVESVRATDRATLEMCHEAFYNPANMIFVAAGDLDPKAVLRAVDAATKNMPAAGERPRTILPEEKPAPYRKTFSEKMAVSRPKYLVGFKDDVSGLTAEERFVRSALTGVLIDTILGKTSQLYNGLYESGLIDATFSASYTSEDNFAYTMMGGDTDNPKKLNEAIFKGLGAMAKRGIDAAAFERKKRKMLGGFLRHFDSAESRAISLASFLQKRVNIFDYLKVINGLKAEAAQERLCEHLRREFSAVSVITPNGAT